MIGWISLHRSDETQVLMKTHPQAFLLLCQIALRAKRRDCRISKLKARQAWIGDWKEAGITSEKAYRLAKDALESCGLVTFQASNKGTLATLADSSVFSLSMAERVSAEGEGDEVTGNGRSPDEPRATNKKERIKKEESIFLPQAGEGECASDPISWGRKIYDAYPRKVGKAAGLKAIRKALRSRPPQFLLERTQQFAEAISWQEPRYIPHPATWFEQERFDDDPAEWENPESRAAAGASLNGSNGATGRTIVVAGRTIIMS